MSLFDSFLILYLPNLAGFYGPAWFLWNRRATALSDIPFGQSSVRFTALNLHVVLPLMTSALAFLYSPNPNWSIWREAFYLAACVILADIWLFVTHRLFHTPALFRRFHYLHHRARDPHVVNAGYQHPLEFAIVTMGTCFVGPLVTQCHAITAISWLFGMMAAGTLAHGGYFPGRFAYFDGHDRHHRLVRYNFGFLFMDGLFRTRASS